jgi:hypothetical protein
VLPKETSSEEFAGQKYKNYERNYELHQTNQTDFLFFSGIRFQRPNLFALGNLLVSLLLFL